MSCKTQPSVYARARRIVPVALQPRSPVGDLTQGVPEFIRWFAILAERQGCGTLELNQEPLEPACVSFTDHKVRNELRSEPLLRDHPATMPTAHVLDQEEWVLLQVALEDSFSFGSLRVVDGCLQHLLEVVSIPMGDVVPPDEEVPQRVLRAELLTCGPPRDGEPGRHLLPICCPRITWRASMYGSRHCMRQSTRIHASPSTVASRG